MKSFTVCLLVLIIGIPTALALAAPPNNDYADQLELRVNGLVKKGELRQAEALVQKQAEFFSAWPRLDGMEYSLRMTIGQAYLARGNRGEALRLFKSAKPSSTCGNCLSSQLIRRNVCIARIYDSQLNFPASFAYYLQAMPSTRLGGQRWVVIFGMAYSGALTMLPFVVLGLTFRWYKRRLQRLS